MDQNNSSYLLTPMPSGSRSEDPDGTEGSRSEDPDGTENVAVVKWAIWSP